MKNNKALKTLFLFNGIFVFAANLLGPLYALFVETIDKNIFIITISWAIFLLSTTFFIFITGLYGDKIKEKEYILMGGYLVRAIAWGTFPSISTVFSLFLLQGLLGLGEALGTPSYDAIFAEHLDKGKYIKQYASWKLVSNILGAIAIIIGGYIVNTFGFSLLFYLMSFLAFFSFFGILVKPRDLL